MKTPNVNALSDSDLMAQFRQHALDMSEVLLDSNIRAENRLVDKMKAIDDELRRRGSSARKALLVLLNDEDLRVRYEAARRSLAVDRDIALKVLREVQASHYMPVAAEAGLTLSHLEQGIFKPT